jgi:hypothetical protein
MTPSEIDAALQSAFSQCEALGYPLDALQKQIICDVMQNKRRERSSVENTNDHAGGATQPIADASDSNPLDMLTADERRSLLQFIRMQNRQSQSWKAKLLDDWLQGRGSGAVQFIREKYGPQWLDQVEPYHLEKYSDEAAMVLAAGDRIEVSNSLWEWVQDDGPCRREWIPCQVVSISEQSDDTSAGAQAYSRYTTCIVRFESGVEYEIQGVYEWNRYNWRWLKGEA